MIFSNIRTDLNLIFGQFSVARKLILNGGAIRPTGLLFLFCRTAALGRFQCTVKIWIWFNRTKGHFLLNVRPSVRPLSVRRPSVPRCISQTVV